LTGPASRTNTSLPTLVDAHLNAYLSGQGIYVDLSLPDVPALQPLPSGNIPLPGDPTSWSESLSTAKQCCTHHLDIFPPGRVAHVIETFMTRTTELDTDEMILILALLAVGRQIELALQRDEGCEDANVFFLLAVRTLDEWGQCSVLALGECPWPLTGVSHTALSMRTGRDPRSSPLTHRRATPAPLLGAPTRV